MEKKKGKYILIGLGVIALGTGGFLLIKHLSKNKSNSTTLPPELETTFLPEVTTSRPTSSSSSGFPLKKGSKGELVKKLQQVLIKAYGSSILPRYGADGDYGSELESALRSKGLPTVIDIDSYSKIISKGSSSVTIPQTSSSFNPVSVANQLRLAILDDSLSRAISALKQMNTVQDYTAVNNEFKKKPIGFVRKTIVTGLLQNFWKTTEKKLLNDQFYRIGLKYNGSQWSLNGLSGIGSNHIKTLASCKVWNAFGQSIIAPKGTILGEVLSIGNGVAEFSTLDDKILFVNTKCISYV